MPKSREIPPQREYEVVLQCGRSILQEHHMTAVQLRRVEKTFGGRKVLDGLELEIPSGGYMVLLGPSGCGKTTTLRLIAGLELPDSGGVEFDGCSVLAREPRHRDVSMVFQQDGLYPHLTVQQSLVFGLERSLGKSELQSRVAQAAEIVGIESLLSRYPDTLSGGELRRGVIAKAIVRRSSVRLLDEPLSALDAPVRYALQQDILRWHRTFPGTTIHVTHDGREAMRMADTIAVLDQGKIAQAGEPRGLYERPGSLAVAKSIGTPPMNLFLATVDRQTLTFPEARLIGRLRANTDLEESVWVGARPEAIRILPEKASTSDAAGISFRGIVQDCRVVESQFHLQVALSEGSDLVNVIISSGGPNRLPHVGSEVECEVFEEDLHLFRRSDGQRIDLGN